MRTDITKSFTWGFLLREQELRRVYKTCSEHAERIGDLGPGVISIKLKDGSLIDTMNLDEVLALENTGQKSIVRLTISFGGVSPVINRQIYSTGIRVDFIDILTSEEDVKSVRLSVVGPNRETVFLAAADLEDRLRQAKPTFSWAPLASIDSRIMIGIVLLFTLSASFISVSNPGVPAVELLESAYKEGAVGDPVQAFIFLEREKLDRQTASSFRALIFALFGTSILFVVGFLVPRFFRAFNFCVGDYIAVYERRHSISRVFWSVFVLGALASLAGGLLLRYL